VKLIFCFLPKLLVSESADLSAGHYLGTGSTKGTFLSQRGYDRESFQGTGIGIVW